MVSELHRMTPVGRVCRASINSTPTHSALLADSPFPYTVAKPQVVPEWSAPFPFAELTLQDKVAGEFQPPEHIQGVSDESLTSTKALIPQAAFAIFGIGDGPSEIPHSKWTRWLCGDGRLIER